MTLDKTWEECLRMWKWVARTGRLKTAWMQKNNAVDTNRNGCFFCQYHCDHPRMKEVSGAYCPVCPAARIDPHFDCMNSKYGYHHPKAFYKKLVELNKKRLAN